jgi:hypothetical protein
MFTYKFTTANPPLLSDVGSVRINQVLDIHDVPRTVQQEVDMTSLFHGITFKSRAKATLTSTKRWVRLGCVRKLSSDQATQVFQSLMSSQEELDRLKLLLELPFQDEGQQFCSETIREIEITRRTVQAWTSAVQNVITVQRGAYATYANWSLLNHITIRLDTTELIEEAKYFFAQKNLVDGRHQPTFHESNTYERLEAINQVAQEFETYLFYYEDMLRDQLPLLATAV